MIVKWDLVKKKVTVFVDDSGNTGYSFFADSIVRNLNNGWRGKDQVVRAITSGNAETDIPVDPMPFPVGRWRIIGVSRRYDKYRAPLIIETNAWQMLAEWALDENGDRYNIIMSLEKETPAQ